MTHQEATVRLFLIAVPPAEELLDEHMSAYGELLPTVFFAEVAKWVVRLIAEAGDVEDAHAAIEVMECLVVAGADDVKDLVVTGFLEGLPPGSEHDERLVSLFGPTLRAELTRLTGQE